MSLLIDSASARIVLARGRQMSWVITGVSKAPLLLDTYTGAAAAYSLRSLSLAYGGSVVRVRRSSDNTEQDFTATQVTDGTLTTFCGAGNGFVRTWYDQSGNGYHMVQTTTTAQPLVVSSGTLRTLSAKPTLVFDGTNDLMNQPTGANWQSISCVVNYTKNLTTFSEFDSIVGGIDSSGSNLGLGIIGTGGTTALRTSAQWGDEFYYNGGTYAPGAAVFPSITSKALVTFISTDAVAGVSGLQIGKDRNQSGRFWGGAISEIIIYPSNQSANRAAIESNINAHYAIY
jgi:hypothetical protein